ncbi:MAG: GNAT family N-acetyltransferase [Rikenellaceae bacterium]|nr:GNAT family N-acetyltransferase [Rikenellaceae bacterium]
MSEVSIDILRSISDDERAQIAALVAQLTSKEVVPSYFDEVVDSHNTLLLTARCNGRIVGVLVLALYPTLTGRKAWIEDVVVDNAERGAGIGRALVERAIAEASERGAATLDLTSNPSRQAAHRLYRACGFEERATTPFRLKR